MNRSPLNSDLSSSVSPNGVPLDWHNVITAKGLSKNEKLKLYVVRLSIGGKQFFLGNAYSHAVGARLYDLALWKFAGKLTRAHKPNEPDAFGDISQADIDNEAPRFNTLYAKIPFLCSEDESLTEDQLRGSRLLGNQLVESRTVLSGETYSTVIGRLKRLRLKLTEEFEHVTAWHGKLGNTIIKLPSVTDQFEVLERQLAEVAKTVTLLETSMEAQQEYYRKVNSETQTL